MSPSRGLKTETPEPAPNPFLRSVANSALERNQTDVSEINAQAFEACRAVIANVRARAGTQALLIFGEAGSGKTHLLSRLRDSLEQDARSGKPSLFVPVRMATNASMIWRWLRRNLVDALLREQSDGRRAIASVILESPEKIAERDRNLGIVIGNLIAGKHFIDSAAWLRGDDLPEEAERALGVSGHGDDEEQEATSQRIVKMICGMGGAVPFVFCFDQVEALQSYQGETAGLFKFGQIVSDLHDGTQNLALLSCTQTSLVPEMEAAIRKADWDRMRHRVQLLPLNWEQAVKLVGARLDTVEELRAGRKQTSDKLWPIRKEGLQDLFKDGFCIARRVIVRAETLFNEWQQKAAEPLEPLDSALGRKYESFLSAPSLADAESILKTDLPKVLHLRGAKLGAGQRANSSLEGITGGNRTAAVAICNQKAGAALIKRLEKVQRDWEAEGNPQLIILRDQRNGIGVNAQKSREVMERLQKSGARFVNVKAEALAALSAIGRLLADARSGDLWHGGDKVPISSVEQWLRNNMPRALDELLDEIAAEGGSSTDELTGMLTALLANTKVIELEAAAAQLNKRTEEVEECGRRNTSLFGFAGGSKRVLFRIVERQPEAQRG